MEISLFPSDDWSAAPGTTVAVTALSSFSGTTVAITAISSDLGGPLIMVSSNLWIMARPSVSGRLGSSRLLSAL